MNAENTQSAQAGGGGGRGKAVSRHVPTFSRNLGEKKRGRRGGRNTCDQTQLAEGLKKADLLSR